MADPEGVEAKTIVAMKKAQYAARKARAAAEPASNPLAKAAVKKKRMGFGALSLPYPSPPPAPPSMHSPMYCSLMRNLGSEGQVCTCNGHRLDAEMHLEVGFSYKIR